MLIIRDGHTVHIGRYCIWVCGRINRDSISTLVGGANVLRRDFLIEARGSIVDY